MAYLFKTVGVTSEQQARNRQDIERVISECMEQVIRAFLPWEAIAKNYFVETPADVPVVSTPTAPTKTVVFEENDDDSDSEEEEEPHHKLQISDEVETIEATNLDEEKKDDVVIEVKEQEDPLKEIENKMTTETLVLNL